MRQWEIYDFPHPSPENPHPCVILSVDQIAGNPKIKQVNAVACTSRRPGDPTEPWYVTLDEADGLDHATVANCLLVVLCPKSLFGEKRGEVRPERRRLIRNKVSKVLGLDVR